MTRGWRVSVPPPQLPFHATPIHRPQYSPTPPVRGHRSRQRTGVVERPSGYLSERPPLGETPGGGVFIPRNCTLPRLGGAYRRRPSAIEHVRKRKMGSDPGLTPSGVQWPKRVTAPFAREDSRRADPSRFANVSGGRVRYRACCAAWKRSSAGARVRSDARVAGDQDAASRPGAGTGALRQPS